MESREYSHVNVEPNDDVAEPLFRRRRCCFCFGWSSSYRPSPASGSSRWRGARSTEPGCLWARGIGALKRIREWSEIVAGPRWKTFIRRFSRAGRRGNLSNYRYDPLSYSLNFDEGRGQNGDFPEQEENYRLSSFSVRYAAIPALAKDSIDLGKDGPSIV